MRKKRASKNPGGGSVDLQVGLGPKIKLHENGPWDGVTAGLAMLSALHGLKPGPEQAEYTSDSVRMMGTDVYKQSLPTDNLPLFLS